ncbi:MAG: metallophosphoesterase family protein [Actinomycetota bacterium]
MTPPRGALLRYAAFAALVLAIALVFGVTTARAESTLGPHRASFEVEVSGRVLFDLGPLGAIHLDSPVAPLGVRVVVHEIPSDGYSGNVLEGLGADAVAYAQLVSQPRAALAPAIEALVFDALGRAAIVAGAGLAVIALLRGSGSRFVVTRRSAAVAGVVALGVVSVGVIPTLTRPDAPATRATVLDGTAFAGVAVSGRLADLVNTWGPLLLAAYEETEAFYDGIAERVARDFSPSVAHPAPRSGWDLPAPPDEDALTTAVFVSDLHCNVSMGRVVAALVGVSGAELILNGGDTVVSGTAAEAFCVNAFAEEFAVPVVVADGNHDSVVTARQEESAGWTVLRGQPIEMAGLRILGDTDPTLTAIGAGTVSERDETVAGLGVRLGRTACDVGGVDVLLVHNPIAAHPAARDGCARLTLSGHLHRQVGPEATDTGGWTYVSSSSGGGNYGGRTIGALQTSADLTVLRFADGEPFDMSVVTIGSDGVVTVGPWRGFPRTTSIPSTSSTSS